MNIRFFEDLEALKVLFLLLSGLETVIIGSGLTRAFKWSKDHQKWRVLVRVWAKMSFACLNIFNKSNFHGNSSILLGPSVFESSRWVESEFHGPEVWKYQKWWVSEVFIFLKISKLGLGGPCPTEKSQKLILAQTRTRWLHFSCFFLLESSRRAGSDYEGPKSSFWIKKHRTPRIHFQASGPS